MATGASTADLAIVLIDARQGVLRQTRRHSIIASLLGIRQIVLAVNKIDLVDYDQTVFDGIVADYRAFAADLGFAAHRADPDVGPLWRQRHEALGQRCPGTRARRSSSISRRSRSAPTSYRSRSASRCSTSTAPISTSAALPARSPPAAIAKGDEVVVAKSGAATRVKRIVVQGGDLEEAGEGQAVTLVLDDEVEVSRGNMLVAPDARPARRRPVRRPHRLVRRTCPDAGSLLHPAHLDRPGERHGDGPQVPHQRQRSRRGGGQDAGDERGRRRQHLDAVARSLSTRLATTARPAPSSSSTASPMRPWRRA